MPAHLLLQKNKVCVLHGVAIEMVSYQTQLLWKLPQPCDRNSAASLFHFQAEGTSAPNHRCAQSSTLGGGDKVSPPHPAPLLLLLLVESKEKKSFIMDANVKMKR